jgi:hypothetical protein
LVTELLQKQRVDISSFLLHSHEYELLRKDMDVNEYERLSIQLYTRITQFKVKKETPLRLNIFRLFVILSLTQLYRYTPEIFLFSTATFKYPLRRIGQQYSAKVAFSIFQSLKRIQPLPVSSTLYLFPTSPQYFLLICDPFADPIILLHSISWSNHFKRITSSPWLG